jgi:hypothetical protein
MLIASAAIKAFMFVFSPHPVRVVAPASMGPTSGPGAAMYVPAPFLITMVAMNSA